MAEEIIPRWTTALIHAEFSKREGKDMDLRYICLNCASESLTYPQKEQEHEGHHVLQAFTCSRFYGYKTKDIDGLKHLKMGFELDASNVVQYKSNDRYIYFPKSRKLHKDYEFRGDDDNDGKSCFTCGWDTKTCNGSFCSILCKLMYEAEDDPLRKAVLIKELVLRENKAKGKEKVVEEGEGSSRPPPSVAVNDESSVINAETRMRGSHMMMECNQVSKPKISLLKRMAMEDERKEKRKREKELKELQMAEKEKAEKSDDDDDADKINGESNGNNLQSWVSNGNPLSFRKRSRKGTPCRAAGNYGVQRWRKR